MSEFRNMHKKWHEPVLYRDNIKECVKDLKAGDFIKVPTGKTNKSDKAGSCTNLAKVKAEVIGITDRLIIVRLPNGLLDSITIKEYAIERIKNELCKRKQIN